jgi:hypothetical protein
MVFDVGGYEGQWSSDIFSKYVCHIHIFEPVPEYAEQIASRMLNDLVKLHPDAEQRLKEIQRGLRRNAPVAILLSICVGGLVTRGLAVGVGTGASGYRWGLSSSG